MDLINNNISRDVQEICIAAMMENSGYLIFEAPPPEKPWPSKYMFGPMVQMVQSFWFLITLQKSKQILWAYLHLVTSCIFSDRISIWFVKTFPFTLGHKMCLRKMDIISVFNSCTTWVGSRQRKHRYVLHFMLFYLIYFSLAANFKSKDHNRQHNTL